MLVELHTKRTTHLLGDKSADALAADHELVGAQRRDRLADHRAGNARRGNHFLLGRQARTGQQLAADDVGGEPRHDLAGQAARRLDRPEEGKIFIQTDIPPP